MELLQYASRAAKRSRRRKPLTFEACSCEILEERLVLSASVIDISDMQLNSAGSCATADAACVTGCICFQQYLSQYNELPPNSAYRVLILQQLSSGKGEGVLVEVGEDLTWMFTNLHPSDYVIQVYAASADGNRVGVSQALDVALTPSAVVTGLIVSVEAGAAAYPDAAGPDTTRSVIDSTQNDNNFGRALDPDEIQIAVSQLLVGPPDNSQSDAATKSRFALDGRVSGIIVFAEDMLSATAADGTVPPQEIIIRPMNELGSDGESRSVTTDSNGRFVIDNLKPGEYELLFHADGNGSKESVDVSVRAGATTRLDLTFRLAPPQPIAISPADTLWADDGGTSVAVDEIFVTTASLIAGVFVVEAYFASRKFRRDLQLPGLRHQ